VRNFFFQRFDFMGYAVEKVFYKKNYQPSHQANYEYEDLWCDFAHFVLSPKAENQKTK
jgi:hypothetical protein